MMPMILIALGAGAASALLVASVATGSSLALPLFYLAPLPIFIVGIAWSQIAALIAVSTACVVLGLGFGGYLLATYLAGVGAPAYALAYLAMMARDEPKAPGGMEWFPVGRLVIAAAVAGTLAVLCLVPVIASNLSDYSAALRSAFEEMVQDTSGASPAETSNFVDLLVRVIPPVAAVLTMATQLGNLWLAGRIARASNRLRRPWPDISALRLPNATPVVLAVAVAAAMMLDGFAGLTATILSSTLLMAYGLLGLAVIHHITRGNGARALLIGGAWLAALLLGWPFLLLALLGLVDTLFGLRERKTLNGGPPAANDD